MMVMGRLFSSLACCSCRYIRTSSVKRLLPRKLRGFISSELREEHFKRKDNVPEHFQLIYRGPMERYVAMSMHLSSISVVVIAVSAMSSGIRGNAVTPLLVDYELISEPSDIYYFAIGFVVINLLVRYVISRIPLRIYKIPDKKCINYMAIYYPQLPLIHSRHQFVQGDIQPLAHPLNPWNYITYKLGNKSTFIFVDYFKTPAEFNKLSMPPKEESMENYADEENVKWDDVQRKRKERQD